MPEPFDETACGWCGGIDHTTGRHPLPEDADDRSALAALRDLLAENEGARRNGWASDGRGWFRNVADRRECYAVAASMLPLFVARWEYGVQWDPGKPDGIHECDDQDHAREWKRDLHWEGPIVRRLVVRHIGGWIPIPEGATS